MKTDKNYLKSLDFSKSLLLDPWEISETDISHALNKIMTCKVDYADLYFQHTCSESWSLEEGIVKTGNFSLNQGVGVRAFKNEKTAFSYSDSLSTNALNSCSEIVRCIAQSGSSRKIKTQSSSMRTNSTNNLYEPLNPLHTLDATSKVGLLEKIEHMARSYDSRVIQTMANLSADYDVVLIAGNDGRLVSDIRPLVRLSLTVIVEHKNQREVGHAGGGGRFGLNYFSEKVLTEYVQHAVREATNNLDARSAPAGEMPVVLGPGWPGVLLHEAVGHGLEGDFNRKGSSIFSGAVGKKVAADGVTIIDNGSLSQRRGSLNVDDEGNLTKSNVLIENGILQGYMQDTLNSFLMKKPITGNARRESFSHLPMPRMTNTYMLSGNTHPEEIISSVKKGIYAVNFSGGQVDITSGKFVFSASEAYLIENGKILYPVKGATIIGNGPDAMKRISLIGNDLKLDSGVGTCGKDGQNVPVGVGIPTILIEGLTVGGTGIY